MKRFILSKDAVLDLTEIWEYIAADSLDAADRWTDRLYAAIRKLADTPGMGHRRGDLAGERALLFWPVGAYLIIYRATKGPIEIVAIVHGNRDIPAFIATRIS